MTKGRKDDIERIEEIEDLLKALKLSVLEQRVGTEQTSGEERRPSHGLAVGDEVVVLNPRPGQERDGRITKVNNETGFVTIVGLNFGDRISRKHTNVRKIVSAVKVKTEE